MNYASALEFLENTRKIGSKPGLIAIGQLLKELGSPENDTAFVHVAGTNGKGSVSTYIATILAKAGYKTGRFSSPPVFAYEEIVQVLTVESNRKDNQLEEYHLSHKEKEETEMVQISSIGEEEYASCMELIQIACDRMVKTGWSHPTSFEIETALAFLFFCRNKCDIAVLETGLGGRMDATNIIPTAKCAVLTAISMDHVEYLGNTLGEIAGHKAGIIKPGIPVVSYKQEAEAEEVIKKVCQSKQADLTIADFTELSIKKIDMHGTEFDYKDIKGLTIKLLGVNQIYNAITAMLAAEAIGNNGYSINMNHIREGLREAYWPGRFERIQEEPLIILDGAHNEGAAIALGENIRTYLQGKVLYYIMGVFKDKDYRAVLRQTGGYCNKIFCITPPSQRALPSKELQQEAVNLGYMAEDAGEIRNAFRLIEEEITASTLTAKDYAIVAFGSLSFLGEVREVVRRV